MRREGGGCQGGEYAAGGSHEHVSGSSHPYVSWWLMSILIFFPWKNKIHPASGYMSFQSFFQSPPPLDEVPERVDLSPGVVSPHRPDRNMQMGTDIHIFLVSVLGCFGWSVGRLLEGVSQSLKPCLVSLVYFCRPSPPKRWN